MKAGYSAASTLRSTKVALCIKAAQRPGLLLQTASDSPQQECLPSCHICTSTSGVDAEHVASSPHDGVWGVCRSALRLKPTFTDAYNNLASALVQKGMIPAALQCYQAALQINPNLVSLSCMKACQQAGPGLKQQQFLISCIRVWRNSTKGMEEIYKGGWE